MKKSKLDNEFAHELKPYKTIARIIQIICFIGLIAAVLTSIWYSFGFGFRLAVSSFVIHTLTNGAIAWVNAKLQIEVYGHVDASKITTIDNTPTQQ
jgi:uncharacterized membrane protein